MSDFHRQFTEPWKSCPTPVVRRIKLIITFLYLDFFFLLIYRTPCHEGQRKLRSWVQVRTYCGLIAYTETPCIGALNYNLPLWLSEWTLRWVQIQRFSSSISLLFISSYSSLCNLELVATWQVYWGGVRFLNIQYDRDSNKIKGN